MLFVHWILSVKFFRMLEAAERVTDEIALDQSDLADSLVWVGALGAGSARDHTTVSQRSSLLAPCPPLRLSHHESWAGHATAHKGLRHWDSSGAVILESPAPPDSVDVISLDQVVGAMPVIWSFLLTQSLKVTISVYHFYTLFSFSPLCKGKKQRRTVR